MKSVSWMGIVAGLLPFLLVLNVQSEPSQVLHGHLRPAWSRWRTLQRMSGDEEMSLGLGLPLRNGEALTNLLEQLYDPGSPNYGRYLTPEQFTERFGPTKQDYQAAIEFATAHGLNVTATHPNRTLLSLKGRVADIERALHVQMDWYSHPSEARAFYAPDREPALDIPVPVLHVSGLNNYQAPRPMSLRPMADPPQARSYIGSGDNGAYMGNDFRTAYVPGTALTGAGQIVGLFELDGYYVTDINAYKTQGQLPDVPIEKVLVDGFNGVPTSSQPGSGNEEVALDIEMAIGMAPGLSKVLVYEGSPGSNVDTINHILNRMATDNLAKQLSCSWGFDIDLITQQIFQQFAAQGQSFFLASGDSGAFSGPVTQPADNPYITVVGGTTLATSGTQSWVAEYVWRGSGGGISTLYSIPDWQLGLDVSRNSGSAKMRNTPDVAMVADNVLLRAGRGRSATVSGTSISAPLWAAFTALVNEQAAANGQPPVGFINPRLYAIGKSPAYAQCFHDVRAGNNASRDSGGLFPAVTGYDLCTGWGTPNGTNLINALAAPLTGTLWITSPLGFTASGPPGGPFNVTTQTYTITNPGTAPLEWSLVNTSRWLQVSPLSGTVTPGGLAGVITVRLNAAVTNLLLGSYSATIVFTVPNSGVKQSRSFSLDVGNGGFEAGEFSNWTLSAQDDVNFVNSFDRAEFVGSSAIPGVDDSAFVHSGIYGAFLGQNASPGNLSQTLPTAEGQRYLLSFWLANPLSGTPNEFHVSWEGQPLLDQVDVEQFAWTNIQYVVTASTSNSVLEFSFRHDQNAFGLDDVTVQALPSLRLEQVLHAQDGISLTWSSSAGARYQLQSATDLTAGNWIDWGDPVTATNGTLTVPQPITADPHRFYRLVLLP